MEEKELLQTTEEVLVLQVCEILKTNNIAYRRQDEGISSYLNITCGSNSGLKRIFVRSEEYQNALKLIEIFEENSTDNELEQEPQEDEQIMDKEINTYKNMKRALFVWIPLIMMIIVVISIIIAV